MIRTAVAEIERLGLLNLNNLQAFDLDVVYRTACFVTYLSSMPDLGYGAPCWTFMSGLIVMCGDRDIWNCALLAMQNIANSQELNDITTMDDAEEVVRHIISAELDFELREARAYILLAVVIAWRNPWAPEIDLYREIRKMVKGNPYSIFASTVSEQSSQFLVDGVDISKWYAEASSLMIPSLSKRLNG
jgi:hypothetical protein